MLYQVQFKLSLENSSVTSVTLILNKKSRLLSIPCSTKINYNNISHGTSKEIYKVKVAIYLP